MLAARSPHKRRACVIASEQLMLPRQSQARDDLGSGIIFPMFTRSWLLLPLLASVAFAQQDLNLRVQSNVVLVPTLVKDAEGHVVYGLKQSGFLIDDDGVEQTVHLDDSAESQPASIVVAIQTGRRAWREYSRMRGVGPMLTAVFNQPRSRVALVEFDSHVRLVEDFSEDETSIYEDLKKLQPGDNGAAIRDAVDSSVRLLEKEPTERQRVLLLVSENRDHGSHTSKTDDIVAAIGNSNTVVYALAFSPVSTAMKPIGTHPPT
jgi:VWFA-related protein